MKDFVSLFVYIFVLCHEQDCAISLLCVVPNKKINLLSGLIFLVVSWEFFGQTLLSPLTLEEASNPWKYPYFLEVMTFCNILKIMYLSKNIFTVGFYLDNSFCIIDAEKFAFPKYQPFCFYRNAFVKKQ